MGELQFVALEVFAYLVPPTSLMELYILYTLLVFLSAQLLIEEHVLSVYQVHRTETRPASTAVKQKRRIVTVGALLAVLQSLTLLTVDTLVAQFALHDEAAIGAVVATIHIIPVVAIFIVVTSSYQVTVFAIGSIINVITVLIAEYSSCNQWHLLDQLLELVKEWSIEIKISSIFQRIPIITPPFIFAVDCDRCILWIE